MGKGIIAEVYPGSLAEELGLACGDKIVSIDGQPLEDMIDFQFMWADEQLSLLVEKADSGEEVIYEIEKEYDEGLGIEFEQGVFDRIKNCHNNCIFCFVDQMGPGLRKSLYEKDDDYRMSFLHGNFITLTNLDDEHFSRIKRMHLSPLFVSVHTVDPELRVKMVRQKKAIKIKEQLTELIEAGIDIHGQIVLCPGYNDGEYLAETIDYLGNLYPNILSIAVVPVGITKFRKDPENFPIITKEYCRELINLVEPYRSKFKQEYGKPLVYLSDEIYITAEMPFPSAGDYDGFPQIENGIGLSRVLLDEFEEIKEFPQQVEEDHIVIATSVLGGKVIEPIVQRLNQIEGLTIEVRSIINQFFGPRVTVTGLLTGSDLIEGLKDLPKGTKVVINEVMLKWETQLFLDDLTIEDVKKALDVEFIVVDNSAQGLVNGLLNKEGKL